MHRKLYPRGGMVVGDGRRRKTGGGERMVRKKGEEAYECCQISYERRGG